jgi:hypothetical protein
MPLTGLVLNRVHVPGASGLSAERALSGAETLAERRGHALTEQLLRLHADRVRVAEREQLLAKRFTRAHPSVPLVQVPARPDDVHDLDGLRSIGGDLADGVTAVVA